MKTLTEGAHQTSDDLTVVKLGDWPHGLPLGTHVDHGLRVADPCINRFEWKILMIE